MTTSSVLVLIVEDDPFIQQDLGDILSDAGFSVVAADCAESAMDIVKDRGCELRAVLTDINLIPGKLKGWDVARAARELYPRMPVVYVTGQGAEEWSSMGVPESILVSKPFVPMQVITALSQLLNNEASHPTDA